MCFGSNLLGFHPSSHNSLLEFGLIPPERTGGAICRPPISHTPFQRFQQLLQTFEFEKSHTHKKKNLSNIPAKFSGICQIEAILVILAKLKQKKSGLISLQTLRKKKCVLTQFMLTSGFNHTSKNIKIILGSLDWINLSDFYLQNLLKIMSRS